jgi:2,3-bisphosphoglycerate-dependent phosphoglycerate mutase
VCGVRNHGGVKVDFQRPFSAPDGAQEILLVRHGACDAPGPGGLIGGRSDPPLNTSGRAQAEAVAKRLARERVSALFVTQLQRTSETAEFMLGDHDVEPVVLPSLGEIFLGEWEGHGIHQRGSSGDPEFVEMMRAESWELVPGAESAAAFAERIREGIDDVAEAARRGGGVAVAVTHAAVIAEICRQVTGSRPFAFLTNANGSVTRLVRMPDRRWLLLSFNETEHLPRE